MKILKSISFALFLILIPELAHSYKQIYQLAGDDFYAYSTTKQCYVPANYSEMGAEWYLHPERLCLDGSDVKQLIPVQLTVDSAPILCPPDRVRRHHFSKCCSLLSCCQGPLVHMHTDNPMQGLIDRYFDGYEFWD